METEAETVPSLHCRKDKEQNNAEKPSSHSSLLNPQLHSQAHGSGSGGHCKPDPRCADNTLRVRTSRRTVVGGGSRGGRECGQRDKPLGTGTRFLCVGGEGGMEGGGGAFKRLDILQRSCSFAKVVNGS
ncbi:hypothetical protein BaRGS_00018269 [Batillaria attramentaria]|uniref:Uncharacterized protein n=1 Tax=Batillaria attramentaria TaxID=370345 RepID=A0ABD0KTZ5_9CAEN